jgi:hypothetical protein
MAYEYRSTVDYFFTTLLNPAAIADTVLTSPDFTGLPTDFSASTPGKYLPLVLHDPALGVKEIVWVTGHSSGSTQVSVVRGKESTTSRAWNAGTLVECAPSSRDVLGAVASTALPSDSNVGSRFALTDKARVVQKTKTAGFQADVGLCLPADVGPNMYAIRPPEDATMIVRTGAVLATTNSSGAANFAFQTPFPNGISTVLTLSTFHQLRSVVCSSSSNFGAVMLCYNFSGELITGVAVSFMYLAIGW